MIRARYARQIRAGIAAAHLPHRLREMWAREFRGPRLTGLAFVRERDRVLSKRLPAPVVDPDWAIKRLSGDDE